MFFINTTDQPYKESQEAWQTRGRHTPVTRGWCACGTASDDASQSSLAQQSSHAAAAAAGPDAHVINNML